MYAAIRQGRAKTGMAEELARRIKEGAIPIISDVPGFMAYYVVYAPDDTVTAISIFNDYAGADEVQQTRARVDRAESCTSAYWASHSDGRASGSAHVGIVARSAILRARVGSNHWNAPCLGMLIEKHLAPQINLASNVIAALSTFETGQFFSASPAIRANAAWSRFGTWARRVRADRLMRKPWPSGSSVTAASVLSSVGV